MAELSYTSRREIDQYGFHPAVTLLAPLGCILLQATIFFAVARRSPIAGAVTGSLIGLVQDGLTNHPFGVNGITKALIGYGAASLGFAVDVDNMLNRAMLLFSFSLVQSLLLYIITRWLLGDIVRLHFGHQLLAALANTVVGVPLFFLLDRFKTRD